jgi:hypothetical protein
MRVSRFAAAVSAAALLPVVLLAPPAYAVRMPEVKVDQAYICWELGPKPPDRFTPAKVTRTGAASCQVPVRLSEPSNDKVVVVYRTEGITAKPDADYLEVEQAELVIHPGEIVGYATVTLVPDCEKEEDERFAVWLVDAYGGVIIEKLGLVTIVDSPEGC